MERPPHRGPVRLAVALAAAGALLVGCTDDAPSRPGPAADADDGPNRALPPTIPGGVELAPTDPASALVGDGLAYGTPLPSEQLAAEALTSGTEVQEAITRRVYAADGRRLGQALLLRLDGGELFDDAALAAFEQALVASLGGGPAGEVELAGRPVLEATGDGTIAMAHREGDLLTVVTGTAPTDVALVVTRQLEARARGEVGSLEPATPMAPLPPDAAFVTIPTVAFAPIPPPEDEATSPVPPALSGATGVHGRYGVVAGERRTTVWVFSLDRGAYPTAEALDPVLPGLASSRADGAPAQPAEVVDRIVLTAANDPGRPTAAVFRHQSLVLLVEGERPDQVAAVATAWITALGPT